jgi:hypothetical protein
LSEPPAPRRGLWRRWIGLLDHREAGTSLALFRIACGWCVLVSVGGAVLAGVAGDVWLDYKDGGYRTLADPPWLFRLLGGVHPATLWPVLTALLTTAALLVAGLGGRVTAFLVLQLHLAVSQINMDVHGGDDQLLGNALWLLVLSRATATLSLDCRWRTGRWVSNVPVAAWPRYLAIYQLVIVYFTAGLQKLSIYWTPAGDFSALYYHLQEPSWQRWDMSWLAWVYPLTQVATAVTWLWEVSSPLLLLAPWYRRTRGRPGRLRAFFNWLDVRRLFVIFGVLMHLGIFVLIGLGPFTWISLAFYICLFHPSEWRAFAQRLCFWRNRSSGQGIDYQPGSLLIPAGAAGLERRWVSRLVYGLVTLHVVAVTLMAIPAPPAGIMNAADWDSPLAHEEFTAWSQTLSLLGFSVSAQDLRETLWHAARSYVDVRARVLAPFQPYYQFCGTRQGWPLFSHPNRFPTRLSIDIREDEQWRTIYEERNSDNVWRNSRLDHEHLRTAIFSLFDQRREFDEFAQWIARRVRQDFPRADQVRVRLYQFHTLPPDDVRRGRRPSGRFVQDIKVTLK